MVNRTLPSRFRALIASIFFASLIGGNLCFHADARTPPRVHTSEGSTATETNRLSLLRGLIKQRAELVRAGKTVALQACDTQIKSHPAPPDGKASALAKHLVGAWRSPRHDYLYRADGTWTMLPVERGALHGRWHIAGNQLEITSGYAEPNSTEKYTVIMIGDEDFVFADRETVFFEKRLPH